jgi:hypothetical protein
LTVGPKTTSDELPKTTGTESYSLFTQGPPPPNPSDIDRIEFLPRIEAHVQVDHSPLELVQQESEGPEPYEAPVVAEIVSGEDIAAKPKSSNCPFEVACSTNTTKEKDHYQTLVSSHYDELLRTLRFPESASLLVASGEPAEEKPKSPWMPSYSISQVVGGRADECVQDNTGLDELEQLRLPDRVIDNLAKLSELHAMSSIEGVGKNMSCASESQSRFTSASIQVADESSSMPQTYLDFEASMHNTGLMSDVFTSGLESSDSVLPGSDSLSNVAERPSMILSETQLGASEHNTECIPEISIPGVESSNSMLSATRIDVATSRLFAETSSRTQSDPELETPDTKHNAELVSKLSTFDVESSNSASEFGADVSIVAETFLTLQSPDTSAHSTGLVSNVCTSDVESSTRVPLVSELQSEIAIDSDFATTSSTPQSSPHVMTPISHEAAASVVPVTSGNNGLQVTPVSLAVDSSLAMHFTPNTSFLEVLSSPVLHPSESVSPSADVLEFDIKDLTTPCVFAKEPPPMTHGPIEESSFLGAREPVDVHERENTSVPCPRMFPAVFETR